MKIVIVLIAILLVLTRSNAQENFINEGTGNIVATEVRDYSFNFGTDWSGPQGSTTSIRYDYDGAAVRVFGEPAESFCFIPPGETECIDIEFKLNFERFENGQFTFGLIDGIDSRICPKIKKNIPSNIIRIVEGDPSCNGVYRYTVTVGSRVDTADSNIEFIGGLVPRLMILNQVTSPADNIKEGYLGTTFQSPVDRTCTIRINATDIQGEPRCSIAWFFKAAGTTTEIPLPGSLADVTITSGSAGQSTLEISGVTQVHLGEYIAVATNEHGSHRESASVTDGVAPFITEGTGQSSSASFRVGADRAVTVGETVSIRAEDRLSDPSSTITWWYSRSESGPFSAISSGGPYSISASTGAGNVGTDSTLTISNVQPSQFGYYNAIATNEIGNHTSGTSLVLVGRAPRLTRGSGISSGFGNIGTQFNGGPGNTIIIQAFDYAGFPDSSYRWQRISENGALQDITSGGRYLITTSTSGGRPVSTLTITGVTQNELGTYNVTASNGLAPDVVESLVGLASSCRISTSVTRVVKGFLCIIARDLQGVPQGTVSWSYSRALNLPRSPLSSPFTSTYTPSNCPDAICINIAHPEYGCHVARITNQFGSSQCEYCIDRQLC